MSTRPAARLRFGFEESEQPLGGYFPFPERFKVDERQLIHMNEYIPVPHAPVPRIPCPVSASKRLPFSENNSAPPLVAPLRADNQDLSRESDAQECATNGLASNLLYKFLLVTIFLPVFQELRQVR